MSTLATTLASSVGPKLALALAYANPAHAAAPAAAATDWLTLVSTYAAIVLLAVGAFISLSGSLGLVRFPDFYARLHTAGKTDSLAQLCIFGGLALIAAVPGPDGTLRDVDTLVRIKLIMVALILFFTAPTATHAITKAAQLDGLKPWEKGDEEPHE